MQTSVFYMNATESVRNMVELEFDTLKSSDVDKLINVFHSLCNWEEEGVKIRPNILLVSSIATLIRSIPDANKITFYHDADTTLFNQRLKTLMTFCLKNWTIYIEFGETGVEYGIVKVLNSIKERDLYSYMFDSEKKVAFPSKLNALFINVVSTGMVVLKGIRGNTTSVCFNLVNDIKSDWSEAIHALVVDTTSKIKTSVRKREDIQIYLTNICANVFKRLHGTLCLVVDKDYKDKGLLSDGTWLPEPIEFAKLFLKSNAYSESKLKAFADVLETMLNYDGITVLDNAGRVLAYNVFVETDLSTTKNIVGGARKRAAYTLLSNPSKRIVGLYFQSQEGDSFYRSKKDAKRDITQADKQAVLEFKQMELSDLNQQ